MKANAAIFYASDGYSPATKGINGRRVAGESFLKGYLRHGEVEEFVILAKASAEAAEVEALIRALRPDKKLRPVGLVRPGNIAPLTNLFYPAANIAGEAWRRADFGSDAWAVCGITHTTSTMGVMQGFFDLRMAPVMDWDAVICTSRAVQGAVATQMDLIDDHIRQRFRGETPPRPMLPVIPLGVHCDDFTPEPEARQRLRDQLGCGPEDVVFSTIARLSPHEKFDPLPVYLAMQAAQAGLKPGQKLHVVMCGQFKLAYARKVFTDGAAKLMPDVGFLLLDGALAADRKAALSGADVFLFMIDNIQETFGLAPLEGMAAGLPLLVSDWDGMKDTVAPEVGLRVKTRTLGPRHLANESLRLQGGVDDYTQYCAAVSAMTEIDIADLTAGILALARNPDLRHRMGMAARKRACDFYDWSVVIPQFQALWGEQDARRRTGSARASRIRGHALPIAPSPTLLFAGYPSETADFAKVRFQASDLTSRASLKDVLAVRNYQALNRHFATADQIAAVLAVITARGADGAGVEAVSDTTRLQAMYIERILIWLLKYDFIRRM